MTRKPLSFAVALALTVFAAGCSHQRVTSTDEIGSDDGRAAADKPATRAEDRKRDVEQEEKLEQVVVTGSSVKQTDLETSQPIFVLGHGQVAQEPAADMLAPPAPPAPSAPPQEMARAANIGVAVMPVLAEPKPADAEQYTQITNTERYADHDDNPVLRTAEQPVSTFSIDVDTGSYTNVRRMLEQGTLPPTDAVRAEEFINYFDYAYTPPARIDTPFSVTTEIAPAPWNAKRQLLLVGIKGYEVPAENIPASNLVFLIDTSGSMQTDTKLPLLKNAFKQLVPKLRHQDRVSIVVYAGSAGLVLPPTAGDEHERIIDALDALEAGGSTNGGAGIELAYKMARDAFIDGGVNRVILATDGDFNVGTVDDTALKTLIEDKRRSGIALTTLGFGEDNYNDELAEQLADVGNGNHAYIDSPEEARKVLVEEMSSTLLTIAKDVKIQIEFNPRVVAEYRLLGYENRMLRREDFNNDKIDAGEIGAGHDVTALYELTLVGSDATQIDALRYGKEEAAAPAKGDELAFLRLRYKRPDEDKSQLIEQPIRRAQIAARPGERLAFAAAVAAFADQLRGGKHLGDFDLKHIAALARDARGEDAAGYRAGFVRLVEKARELRQETDPAQVTISE